MLLALAWLVAATTPAREASFPGLGTLVVPDGCVHKPREGIDSAVGAVECGRARIEYDIGFASPGAKPAPRGWCTGPAPGDPAERVPLRVLEVPLDAKRSLFVCELPPYYSDPARLVAVPSPTVSFYTAVGSPDDASWLLTVALAFRPPATSR